MNWSKLIGDNWAAFVNRFSDDIHDSSKGRVADGHLDRVVCVNDRLSSN
jgi:hypothetical protein